MRYDLDRTSVNENGNLHNLDAISVGDDVKLFNYDLFIHPRNHNLG